MAYTKIDRRIQNDARFRALSHDGRYLYYLVLTHPHMTSLGVLRSSPEALAHEYGWSEERTSKGFREALAQGLLEWSPECSWICSPNWLKYNGAGNPNILKSWGFDWDRLPEGEPKTVMWHRLKAFAEGFGKGFREAFRKAFGEAPAKAPQESVAVAVAVTDPSESTSPQDETDTSAVADQRATIRRVFEFWKRIFQLDGRVKLTDQRRGKIRARLRDSTLEEIEAALRGWASDPWRHESLQRHDLSALLRNRDAVEKGIAKQDERKGGRTKGEKTQDEIMDAIRKAQEADDAHEASLQREHGGSGDGAWREAEPGKAPYLLGHSQRGPDGPADADSD